MECVFLTRLLLSLLLERDKLAVSRTVLPEVDDVVAGDDHMSLVHFAVFGLDGDGFALDGTPDGVAEN